MLKKITLLILMIFVSIPAVTYAEEELPYDYSQEESPYDHFRNPNYKYTYVYVGGGNINSSGFAGTYVDRILLEMYNRNGVRLYNTIRASMNRYSHNDVYSVSHVVAHTNNSEITGMYINGTLRTNLIVLDNSLKHNYNLSDVKNKPSDDDIDTFINSYPFVFPLKYDENGELHFKLIGSQTPVSLNTSEDEFIVTSNGFYELNLDGTVKELNDKLTFDLSDKTTFTTEIGSPNTAQISYTFVRKSIEISNLLVSVIDLNNLMLTWENPDSEKYLRTRVYLNGELVNESQNASFKIENLKYDTIYNIKVTAVYVDGKESPGIIQSIKTEKEPPKQLEAPSNFFVKSGNKSLFLNWSMVYHEHFKGYNLYVNDEKINDKPILRTAYTIQNLENDQEYEIKVSAVADDGEGFQDEKFSEMKIGVPKVNAVPPVAIDYGLIDLTKSVNSMFSSIWLILAFSLSIPLSIFIAHRVKSLFIG